MNKLFIWSSLLFSCFVLQAPAQKPKKAENWIDAAVKQKSELRSKLAGSGMPVVSSFVKAKQKAEPISADLTGLEELVLITSAGPDGNDWDWGTWANAKLIKADGSFVWLEELDPYFWFSGSGSISKEGDLYGNPLTIGGKPYEHSVLCHADGVMIYALDEEFVRFEAEVGLADQSTVGSVYFRVQNVFPKEEVAQLVAKYPKEMGTFSAHVDALETWLSSTDASLEKETILTMTAGLKDNSYFKNAVREIEKESNVDTQIRKYLELYEKAYHVCELQADLEWLKVESVSLAFDDMKK